MAVEPVLGTLTTIVTSGLSTLADTASTASDVEQDNTTDKFLDAEIQLQFIAAGATTGSVEVYALVGLETSVLSSQAKKSNMRRLGSVELNGTTIAIKTLRFENMDAFYWKLYFTNSSGAALTAASVKFRGINYADV